jgi:hypothetical protein
MKPEKQLTLLASGILLVSLFFLLPRYQNWGAQRLIPYWMDFKKQKFQLNPEYRKKVRYESAYTISKQIADFFEKKGIKQQALLLLPPSSYFKKFGIAYHVPEPAVFYYYTGMKTVWVNSSNALKADWYVHCNNGNIVIDSVTNIHAFSDTLKNFQTFAVSL